jgi:hypothetical protein
MQTICSFDQMTNPDDFGAPFDHLSKRANNQTIWSFAHLIK